MKDFSFAYMKEAFVATLLVIAGNRSGDDVKEGPPDEDDKLDKYELWREIKRQVKNLRSDMDSSSGAITKNERVSEERSTRRSPPDEEEEREEHDELEHESQIRSITRQRFNKGKSPSTLSNMIYKANEKEPSRKMGNRIAGDGERSTPQADLLDRLACY